MKIKKIATALLAGLLAVTCVLPLTACKNGTNPSDDTVVTEGKAKVKVLKMGRALASVIRTKDSTILIDTGDVDHVQDVITYLSDKEITTIDAVIFTNYSKKCIGGMPDLLAAGYTDSFRYLYPTTVKYSWWSYMRQARANNAGWRIDYFVISNRLRPNLKDSFILNEVMGSDHCPVGIEIEL